MRSSILLEAAASFVDDTSSNLARASGQRVSIHSQVLGECALGWFYRLLQKVPNDGGREIKSDVLARAYFVLPSGEQDRLLRSLRLVRIHITDPGPYMRKLRDSIERIVPGHTLETFMTRLEQAESSVGARVRRTLMESVASDMLWNSPYEQLKLRFRIMNVFAGLSVDLEGIDDSDDEPEPATDFSPFVNRSGHLVVDRVALFSSKTGPVFGSALELIDEFMGMPRGEIPSMWVTSLGVQRRLSALHVFDEGNNDALRWVEQRRSEALSFVDPFKVARVLPPPPALVAIDSKTSPYVHAADVAAGIARTLFETDKTRLRATFDYLMENGQQIGAAGR